MSEAQVQTATATTTQHRRRRRAGAIAAAVAVIVVAALGAGYLWLSATSQPENQGQAECDQAPVVNPGAASDATVDADIDRICATVTSLADAWGDHDADAYGAAFTEYATYTTFMGTHYSGREDIVESHRELFDGPLEGTQLADSFLSVTFLNEDAAVIATRGDTYEGDRPEELTKVQTYTVTRTDGDEWKISSFHNTKRDGVMERLQFLMSPESQPSDER